MKFYLKPHDKQILSNQLIMMTFLNKLVSRMALSSQFDVQEKLVTLRFEMENTEKMLTTEGYEI